MTILKRCEPLFFFFKMICILLQAVSYFGLVTVVKLIRFLHCCDLYIIRLTVKSGLTYFFATMYLVRNVFFFWMPKITIATIYKHLIHLSFCCSVCDLTCGPILLSPNLKINLLVSVLRLQEGSLTTGQTVPDKV